MDDDQEIDLDQITDENLLQSLVRPFVFPAFCAWALFNLLLPFITLTL